MRSPYDSLWWRRVRKRILAKHSLCRLCLLKGRLKIANTVDHKIPWTSLEPNVQGSFYCADSNLQSLCVPCHSKKTHTDNALALRERGKRLSVNAKTKMEFI